MNDDVTATSPADHTATVQAAIASLLTQGRDEGYATGYAAGYRACQLELIELLGKAGFPVMLDQRPTDDILALSVDVLDLSERSRNCLRRAQIDTIGELIEKTEDDLLGITNFGQKGLDEVILKLRLRGLNLKPAYMQTPS